MASCEFEGRVKLCNNLNYSVKVEREKIKVLLADDFGIGWEFEFRDAESIQKFSKALPTIAENLLFTTSKTLDSPENVLCPNCMTKSFLGMVDDGHGNMIGCPHCSTLKKEWEIRNTIKKEQPI